MKISRWIKLVKHKKRREINDYINLFNKTDVIFIVWSFIKIMIYCLIFWEIIKLMSNYFGLKT